MRKWSPTALGLVALGIGLVLPATAYGQNGEPWQEVSEAVFRVNNLWIMIAAFLVFIMHLGFAMVESGMTRAKNTVNILFKNIMIICIGLASYAIIGWQIMYHSNAAELIPGWLWVGLGIGGGEKGVDAMNTDLYNTGYTVWTDFLFQAMFAATAATIVSGAVAGRIKLLPFLVFSTIFVAISYPITGSWHWSTGGWLDFNFTDALPGFQDFAGSTVVHAVGGAGALMLGPRLGKYAKDGSVQPIPGHNIPLATIGVFLLWFGWFGFNGGSELDAAPGGASWVVVTTALAAAGGGLAAAITCWIHSGKPDPTMGLNGILGGLVGITACCHLMNWIEAMFLVGAVSGVLVYFAVLAFDRLGVDDPVGAISVHGVVGIYGTLCAGLWGSMGMISSLWYNDPNPEKDLTFAKGGAQFVSQIIGCGAIVLFTLISALVIFSIVKAVLGLRVSQHEEIEGLDLGEHDMSAYPDFQRTYIKSYHAGEI
jgi:Amt family ammonium transporter